MLLQVVDYQKTRWFSPVYDVCLYKYSKKSGECMLVIFILRLVCSGIISGGGVDRLSAYYE